MLPEKYHPIVCSFFGELDKILADKHFVDKGKSAKTTKIWPVNNFQLHNIFVVQKLQSY